jgi:hypothetical protein
MAIKRPDIYEHNNPNDAFIDSNFVRGGFRTAVADLTALYALSIKTDQLKQNATVVYVSGLTTYYELVDIVNVGNVAGWEPFLSTTAAITGAANGLTLSNKKVILGGALTGATSINLNNNTLKFKSDSGTTYGLMDISLNGTYTSSKFGICSQNGSGAIWGFSGNSTTINAYHCTNSSNGNCLAINNSNIVMSNLTSSVSKTVILGVSGLTYGACYHTSYSSRSLVDKQYVDNCVAGVSNIINVVNTGVVGYTTTLGDEFVGVSGSSCICLYATPVTGQKVIISDICGNALNSQIFINGNGHFINDGLVSTINTNYGAISYVYNGYCWSTTAFVN